MALDKVIDSTLLDAGMKATADAIREKTGGTDPIVWDSTNGFKTAVEGIQAGVPINNQDKNITQNGTYSADDGYTGLGTVTVKVASLSDSEWEEQFAAAISGDGYVDQLPYGITKIRKNAFNGAGAVIAFKTIPDTVTFIDESAFQNCTQLSLISLPDGVTQIGSSAFSGCQRLALTHLPSKLEIIRSYAFSGCYSFAITSIPEGVRIIEGYAFQNCNGTTEITFRSKPTTFHNRAFNGCPNLLTINVPWAEGEVDGAPWGATNATINYNYTGG